MFHARQGLRVLAIMFFSAFFLMLSSCPLSGDTTKQSATRKSTTNANAAKVAEIEKYCTEAQGRTRKREPDFVFGLPSSIDTHQAQWQTFASTAELQKAAEGEANFDQQVYVWMEGGKIIAANFTLQSESGDWALYPNYCFRKNGTTAEIRSELRTFYGGMLVRRDWKFDSNGHLIESDEKFLDLKTENPKKPDEDFFDEETPLYHKASDLPFLSLLWKPPTVIRTDKGLPSRFCYAICSVSRAARICLS